MDKLEIEEEAAEVQTKTLFVDKIPRGLLDEEALNEAIRKLTKVATR
jgi:hypothetical protein